MSSRASLLTMCQEASDPGLSCFTTPLLGIIFYKVSDPQDSPETGGRGDGMGRKWRCRIGSFFTLVSRTLSKQVFETPRLKEHSAPPDKELEIELQNVDTSKAEEWGHLNKQKNWLALTSFSLSFCFVLLVCVFETRPYHAAQADFKPSLLPVFKCWTALEQAVTAGSLSIFNRSLSPWTDANTKNSSLHKPVKRGDKPTVRHAGGKQQ